MKDVYVECPVLGNGAFLLQRTVMADAQELLEVYSDEKAVPFSTVITVTGTIFLQDAGADAGRDKLLGSFLPEQGLCQMEYF